MCAVYGTKAESCQDGLVSGRRLPTSRHIPPSEIDDHKASIVTKTHTKPLNGTPSYLSLPGVSTNRLEPIPHLWNYRGLMYFSSESGSQTNLLTRRPPGSRVLLCSARTFLPGIIPVTLRICMFSCSRREGLRVVGLVDVGHSRLRVKQGHLLYSKAVHSLSTDSKARAPT